ncbi:MAG: ATP-dependent helicase HrpB [Bacteroidota bacterium]|jgi:ATP-dependent helicase HrpB
MSYPVLDTLDDIRAALASHPIAILQAPPGAGKSTVLPLHLLDEPWLQHRKILMLEPRRLAARAVAQRMAHMLSEDVGQTVGYSVRFESRTSRHTRIHVVTEGVMTRMIQPNDDLEDTGLIIFDEFHERSLQSDLALALVLRLCEQRRPDLRILIMSATLETSVISERLNRAPVVTSRGREFPVQLIYLDDGGDAHVSVRVAAACRQALREQQGDILVFLPGSAEIRRTLEILEEQHPGFVVLPLYGDLPFDAQQRAIVPDPQRRRKIVLATSIAETSLTIEGVSVVIDSGLSRVPRFNARTGLTRLTTVAVTRDAADQRAGRAGRLGPGVCYRLWSERSHKNLVPARSPEIEEADLAPLVLSLAAYGIRSADELTWITPPPAGHLKQATELLQQLGALDGDAITARGREMARLPTHPRLAHMLTEAAHQEGMLPLAIDCAALLEERDPLPAPYGADLAVRVDELRKFRRREPTAGDRRIMERIEKLVNQWRKILNAPPDSEVVAHDDVGALLLYAYPDRVARQIERQGTLYKLINGRMARLPAGDTMVGATWIVAVHLDAGEAEGRIFLAAGIDPVQLIPMSVDQEIVRWDATHERIIAVMETRVGSLILDQRQLSRISIERRREVICNMIRERGLKVMGWSDAFEQWQARVMCLRKWNNDETWPDVTDDQLLATLETWLGPYLDEVNSLQDLQRIGLDTAINALISWDQQQKLDTLAPIRIKVPSGSELRLKYSIDGQPPVLEVRLQEVFGWIETPSINGGRTRVLLHLLSPGFRLVQVTGDLSSFWNTGYAEVKKELRRRYPKHAWPDDPRTAAAVRGVAKRR